MNDKIIDNLERYYKAFIDQQDNWAFFLGLAYYVDFVLETTETRKTADLLTQEMIAEKNKIKKLGEELLKEVKPVKEILIKRIKDAGISYPSLNYEINDFEDFELRGAMSSTPLPATLAEGLNCIIWNLSQNGHKELIKDFISEKNGIVYIDKHEFSKKFEEYEDERQKHKDKEERDLWGLWGYISFAYVAVLKADEEMARVKKDKANWFTAFNLIGYFGEMKKIREGKTNDIIEFKKEKYRPYATIIHSHLIKELNKNNDDFKSTRLANEKMAKQFLEKAEMEEKIKNSVLSEIQKKKSDKNKDKKIILYLSKRGELYQEPKEKHCYPIEETSNRHKIVRFFVENCIYDYYSTEQIALKLELVAENLMKQIGNINTIVKGKLKIKDKILEGKRNSGYRINPKYKIIEK